MTKNIFRSIYALLALAAPLAVMTSCTADTDADTTPKGRQITISATVDVPASRTAYADDAANKKLDVSWAATEKITVISIGDAGITAINEFTSTGEAGREVANFSGTFTGNPTDKVVCLYPAVSTPAGGARFSGVTVGSTQIELNFPAHAPSTNIATLKDWDVMVGTADMAESTATVRLYRQIAVLKLGVQGVYPWDGESGMYIINLGVSATDASETPKAFASHGVMSMTKAGFTPQFTPDQYYTSGHFGIDQQSQSGEYMYYIPIFGSGTLVAGDKLRVDGRKKARWGYGSRWEQYNVNKTFTIPAGKTMSFQSGTVVVAHVTMP